MNLTVSQIAIYPIKSLGAVKLRDSVVGRRGLDLDRRFMLVNGDGTFLTQREHPLLARIRVEVSEKEISISFANRTDLRIPLNEIERLFVDTRTVQVWDSSVEALTGAGFINKWFSDVIGSEVSLAYMPPGSKRRINEAFNKGNDIVSFADGYPLLVTNSSSLLELNSRLDKPVPMNRFRPNIIIDGADAFEEDDWKAVSIGGIDFRVTKPCVRCVITTIDQESGEKHRSEPLKTLAEFRKASKVFPESYTELGLGGNDVLFGTNLVPETDGGKIAVGDELIAIC